MKSLKVVQLNFWYGKRFGDAISFLESVNADVICLQEIPSNRYGRDDGGERDLIEELEERLEMQSTYAPMWEFANKGKNYQVGVLVLTKKKILESEKHFFYKSLIEYEDRPGPGKWEFPGLALRLKLDIEGKQIDVVTTHFVWSLYPEITSDQKRAIKCLVEYLEDIDELVLTGDFNVTDTSEIYQTLVESGLRDDRPVGTKHTLHPEIHPVGKKEIAVDFVFSKGSLELVESEVPVVPASDHLPVVCEYKID